MIPFSVLDLSPITEGGDARQALDNSRDLALHAERWGYRRYWMAEHHNMPGIASAATAVALAHVGQGTSTIRLGAGGIMLPNHAPFMVAEQFGTLASIFPGRIDLALGRAPGTDPLTARALRRNLASGADRFPDDVLELMAYFRAPEPGQRLQAIPGVGLEVPLWILGSSTYGAQLAAALGLPYAFASHFAPGEMMQALELYRGLFQPSAQLAKPYVMLGYNVFAAETDAEAERLATSMQQAFVNLRSGRPAPLPPPRDGYLREVPAELRGMLESVLSCTAIGAPDTVQAQIEAFLARTGADELMITSGIYDHQARLRSLEITADVRGRLQKRAA